MYRRARRGEAFEQNDPTKNAQNLIKLGLRPSLVPILIDFMSNRKMQVKCNGNMNKTRDLIGGSPQGSPLGQDSYIVSSNDNTDGIEDEEDIFLEIVLMANLLQEYH